ncbi:MAG: hypothetical protein QXG51_07405 [Nitrososphaerota archaeon]
MNLNLTIMIIAGLTIIISLLIPEYVHETSKHKRSAKLARHRNSDLLMNGLSRLRKGGRNT